MGRRPRIQIEDGDPGCWDDHVAQQEYNRYVIRLLLTYLWVAPPDRRFTPQLGAGGRRDFGSFATIVVYEVSTSSRISSSGTAPPSRTEFQPERPM